MAEIENKLEALRQGRGFTVAQLARMAGVTRQTVYAMEAGDYVPNTAVALRLARALETTVEKLFTLPGEPPALRSEQALLLPGSEALQAGQPVQLCQVDKRLMACAPSAVPWYFPASDAVAQGRGRVQVFQREDDFRGRILIAGCDPGISVLARHVEAAGV